MTLQRTLALALAAGLLGSISLQPLSAAPRFGGGGDFRSGYQGTHPMFGAGTRPTWGSSNRVDASGTRIDASGTRIDADGNRTNASFDNDRFNRQVNVNNNFYNRDGNGWNRNWAGGGYWNNRPWNAGWYRGAGAWGWWGASAAAWGMAGLATGAVIGGLVNAAANQQSPVFVVPNSPYQLNYGSVEAVGSYGVSFNYLVDGTQLMGAADCQQGLLNGQIPGSSSQAQLLNAVCQVAYGPGA